MPLFKRSLAGPGYTILNMIRGCNIICLLATIAASVVMIVKTFAVSKFFFFDGLSHLVTAVVAAGLTISETRLFRRYIAENWPLLSPAHGFVLLGIMMITLGVSTLGNLNKEATSQKSLGTPMWRCVISAGVLTCIFGAVNIFANYIFRQKSLGVTARQVRAYGAEAPQKTSPYITPNPSTRRRSFHLRRSKTEILPSYHTRHASNASDRSQVRNVSAPLPNTAPNGLGMGYYGEKPAMSHEDAAAGREGGFHCPPVVEGVPRPDLAHHPAYANVGPRPPSSVYTRY